MGAVLVVSFGDSARHLTGLPFGTLTSSVGGVAGGASAAARARRLCEKCEIIVFERGSHVSFANCGLPYFVGGEIVAQDDLLLQTPETLRARFNLDVHVRTEVVSIDRAAQRVKVRELDRSRI